MSWPTNTNPNHFTLDYCPQPEQRSILQRDITDEKQRAPFQPRQQSPIEQRRSQHTFKPTNKCYQCNQILVCYSCNEHYKLHNDDGCFQQSSSLRNPRNVHFNSFTASP